MSPKLLSCAPLVIFNQDVDTSSSRIYTQPLEPQGVPVTYPTETNIHCVAAEETLRSMMLPDESTELVDSLADHLSTMEDERDADGDKDTKPKSTIAILFGYLCGIIAATGYTASLACAQALGGLVPIFELNLWRFGINLIVVVFIMVPCRLDPRIPRKQIVPLFVIANSAFASNTFLYEAAKYLPLTGTSVIYFSVALVASYIAEVLFQRKCSIPSTLAVMMAMAGLVLVLQPQFLFDVERPETHPVCWPKETYVEVYTNNSDTHGNISVSNGTKLYVQDCHSNQSGGRLDNDTFSATNDGTFCNTSDICCSNRKSDAVTIRNDVAGYLLAALSGLVAALGYVIGNKYLQGIDSLVISFWRALVPFTLSGFAVLIVNESVMLPSTIFCVILLLVHSLGVSVGAMSGNNAILCVKPNLVFVILTLEIILTLCLQYTVFKNINPGYRNAAEIIGAVLVFLGNVLGPFYAMWNEAALCNKWSKV